MLRSDSLWDLVERRAEASPDALCAVDEHDREVAFGEYKVWCERVAAGLARDHGIGEGDVVSWQLPTWIEALVLVGALARLGAVQNPILPICRAREVGFMTRQARARLLIVPSVWRGFDYATMAHELGVEGLDVLVSDRTLPEGDAALLADPPSSSGKLRWIFYTSGTTADPKGAMHTDATIEANAYGISRAVDYGPEDRDGFVFPFTHIGGVSLLFCGLMCGFGHILVESFDPDTTIPVLSRHGITVAGAGTAFWLAYVQAQRKQPGVPIFPRLRACNGGGSAKPPTLHGVVKHELGGVGIASGYGLTECPSHVLGAVTDPDDKLATTDGRPVEGVELRVVAPDGTVLGPGEEGEIRVKGPMLMLGYVDSSLDADTFDGEGFLRTGDLGRLDDDGYLTITGRLKDIIIRKGENISAKEIEGVLYAHPRVDDVAVVGLPDAERGERCCAVVVAADGGFTFDDMTSWCREAGLMTQKIPEQLELVDTLPRNPSGKVLKHVLQERFGDG
jgi:cyclohexanecarboxylate-CoA ligase